MAVEGLKNTYGVPGIRREQDRGMNQQKKERRQGRKKRKEEMPEKPKEGRIDIRI